MMASSVALKELVHKTFSDIATHQELLTACSSEWKDMKAFIAEIDATFQQGLEELSTKEKAFDEENNKAMGALDRREEAIPAYEEAAMSRAQQQREEALSLLEKEKRKLQNPKQNLDTDAAAEDKAQHVEDAPREKATGGEDKSSNSEVKVRPELKFLCATMDGEGLRLFIVNHRKEIGALRNEVNLALQSAVDPCRMVLDALKDCQLVELDKGNGSVHRRACLLLLDCLMQVLANPLSGVDRPVISDNTKKNAKKVADLWMSKRDPHTNQGNDSSLYIQAFLQMLAVFGIGPKIDSDELLKLVTAVSRRKQTPALCQSLGLTDKMPEFVDKLVKDCKQMEALSFAHFFNLMDRVQPGPMIKAYLKEVRRAASELSKNVSNPAAGKNDSIVKELSAVKAVLAAIQEYNLAEHYPSDGLKKRLAQLERAKSERKGTTIGRTQQAQSKKPRISGAGGSVPLLYDRRPVSYGLAPGVGNKSPVNAYGYGADILGGTSIDLGPYTNLGYTGYHYGSGLVNPSAYQSAYV